MNVLGDVGSFDYLFKYFLKVHLYPRKELHILDGHILDFRVSRAIAIAWVSVGACVCQIKPISQKPGKLMPNFVKR